MTVLPAQLSPEAAPTLAELRRAMESSQTAAGPVSAALSALAPVAEPLAGSFTACIADLAPSRSPLASSFGAMAAPVAPGPVSAAIAALAPAPEPLAGRFSACIADLAGNEIAAQRNMRKSLEAERDCIDERSAREWVIVGELAAVRARLAFLEALDTPSAGQSSPTR